MFRYETIDKGKYSITNKRGRVVYRDHGKVVTTYLFDTLGDSQPGGEYLGPRRAEEHVGTGLRLLRVR